MINTCLSPIHILHKRYKPEFIILQCYSIIVASNARFKGAKSINVCFSDNLCGQLFSKILLKYIQVFFKVLMLYLYDQRPHIEVKQMGGDFYRPCCTLEFVLV